MKHLLCEPKQMVIDGDFPTVKSPTRRTPRAFYLAVELARAMMWTSSWHGPRTATGVGIMVRDKDGEYKVMTGNQTGVVLLDYMLGAMKRRASCPRTRWP